MIIVSQKNPLQPKKQLQLNYSKKILLLTICLKIEIYQKP